MEDFLPCNLATNESLQQISVDAIVGVAGAIIGVIIGWLLSLLTEYTKTRVGKLKVDIIRSWGENPEYDEQGHFKTITIRAIAQINNSKNVSVNLYDWKVYLCANERKYEFEIYNSEAIDRVLDVVTVHPKQLRMLMLERKVPFETYKTFYDTYNDISKESYKGVGQIRKIEDILISYRSNVDSKNHTVKAEKFSVFIA